MGGSPLPGGGAEAGEVMNVAYFWTLLWTRRMAQATVEVGSRRITSPPINHQSGTAWYGLGTGLVHPQTSIIINEYRVWYTGTPWRPYGRGPPTPGKCRLTFSAAWSIRSDNGLWFCRARPPRAFPCLSTPKIFWASSRRWPRRE